MGTTEILQIEATDTMLQLNGLQDIGLPMIGTNYGAAEAVVDSFNRRAESVVLSNIPEMYRQMTREIRGEIVVEMAYDGQDTMVCGLFPVVEDTLDLYVDFGRSGSDSPIGGGYGGALPAVNAVTVATSNYGSNGRIPYTFRQAYDKLPRANYTVDTATGTVTLVDFTLRGGQKVYADYKHTGMAKCHNLRDITIMLAAANFGNSLSGISESARDFLVAQQQTAMNQLYALMRGEGGIDLLDQLKLVDETRQPYRTPRKGFSFWM